MLSKTKEILLPSNKSFGLFFSVVMFLISIFFIINFSFFEAFIFLGISIFFLLTSFIKPDLLLTLNKLWMIIGLLLGKLVSPIILGTIYFGMIFPISIVTKLIGRDELDLRLNNKFSFWKEINNDSLKSKSFKNQF